MKMIVSAIVLFGLSSFFIPRSALDESGTLFRSFQVMNVPTIVITDAGGKIVRRVEPADAAAALSNSLRGLLSN